jgi:hypothetical protein
VDNKAITCSIDTVPIGDGADGTVADNNDANEVDGIVINDADGEGSNDEMISSITSIDSICRLLWVIDMHLQHGQTVVITHTHTHTHTT